MNGWQFNPWNFQYLIGFLISTIISFYVYNNSRTSKITKSFFMYGISVMGWNLIVFIHRSAPTFFISNISFRISSSFGFVMFGLISLTLLYMYNDDVKNILILLPSLIISFVVIMYGPFEIIQTPYGLSYKSYTWFMKLVGFNLLFYIIAALVIGIFIIKKIKSIMVKLKVKIILFAAVVVYLGGILLTNVFLFFHPGTPPFGGIITTLQFLLIAYAVSIEEKDIVTLGRTDEAYRTLSGFYLDFLNGFQSKMPGKELGESTFRFTDYLKAMGLGGIIEYREGEPVLKQKEIEFIAVEDLPDTILRVIKKESWANALIEEYRIIFTQTYRLIKKNSNLKALSWYDNMMKLHGPYLYHEGILDDISEEVEIPGIYEELQPGMIRLFKEKEPKEVYELAEDAQRWGYSSLYLSKYKHLNVNNGDENDLKLKYRYDSSKMSIYRISTGESDRCVSPKNVGKICDIVSEFSENHYDGLIIMDSLDQILFANGLDNTLKFLKKIVDDVKIEEGTLLISIDLDLFDRSDLQAIKKVLKED